jgi:peptide-methionine (S)-S-oxide reductase
MLALNKKEIATLGGGCFWCLEAVYLQLKGVEKVESGYMGGAGANPSYEQVCSGRTGHAEVVQITFDPALISFQDILDVFFTIHDPTTLNRQGNDIGSQYRSVVFYHTSEQKQLTEKNIVELNASKIWGKEIVTEVMPAEVFYCAEDYHQNYFAQNPNQSYCQVVVAPKVAKARAKFFSKLKS